MDMDLLAFISIATPFFIEYKFSRNYQNLVLKPCPHWPLDCDPIAINPIHIERCIQSTSDYDWLNPIKIK